MEDGGIKMKWYDDPYREEKYQLFDAIIALAREQNCEAFGNISIRQVTDFIDKFFDSQIKERDKGVIE